jgi:hypothetical protein
VVVDVAMVLMEAHYQETVCIQFVIGVSLHQPNPSLEVYLLFHPHDPTASFSVPCLTVPFLSVFLRLIPVPVK